MRLIDFFLALLAFGMGLFGLGIAYAFLPSLLEYLQIVAAGQDWEFGELARHFGLVSGPSCLALLILMGAASWIGFSWGIRARAAANPDEPWLWRREWAERRIQLSNRSAVYATLAICGFFFSLVVPMCVAMAEVKNGGMIYSFLGLFTLILLGVFRLLWTNRVWNRSLLELETLPGVIGGPFKGDVFIPEVFPADTPFRVTLRCYETSKRSSRGSMHTEILWQDQHVVSKPIDARRTGVTAIPARFSIPFDCEPTGTEILGSRNWIAPTSKVRGNISWSLSVTLKSEGDTREAKFDIPVFKTTASSPNYAGDLKEIETFLEPVNTAAVLSRFPFNSTVLADGSRLLKFSLFKPELALFLLGLSGGSVAALWALVVNVEAWPVTLIFGMLPVALIVIGVTSLFEIVCWRSAVAIYADRVEFKAGYLGRQTTIVCARDKPIPVSIAEEFRKDNGAWWSVQVVDTLGKPMRVIKRLDGKQEAVAAQKWLIQQIELSK